MIDLDKENGIHNEILTNSELLVKENKNEANKLISIDGDLREVSENEQIRLHNKLIDMEDPDNLYNIYYPGFSYNLDPNFKINEVKRSFPVENEENDIFVLEGLLTNDECQKLIDCANKEGFFKVDGFENDRRDNSRRRTRDLKMSETIYNRIYPFLPQKTIIIDECRWDACRFLDYWRFLKYGSSQKFRTHYDGSKKFFNDEEDRYEMSIFTLNAYLNDGFTSGGTRFYMKCKENAKVYDDDECGPITHVVNPQKGCALIFNHCNKGYLHDGEPLSVSEEVKEKYLMRADLVYRCRKEDIPILKRKMKEGTCRFWNYKNAQERLVEDFVGNTWKCACCNFNGY